MEETIHWGSYDTPSVPKGSPAPKTNETRMVEALESIASEMFNLRQLFESLTDEGGGFCDERPAIRTTGR